MSNTTIFHPPLPQKNGEKLVWNHLYGASIGLALTNAITDTDRPLLIIAPDSLTASHLIEELSFFSNEADKILYFPDWETLPYDHFSPHQDIISERLATLYRLPHL